MNRIMLFCLLIFIGAYSAFAQITIDRNDFVNLGDEIPRIYYSFVDETESVFVDSVINDPLVFDDFVFETVIIDTLEYFDPSETDVEGYYTEATCSHFDREERVMHLQITDNIVNLVGVQGQLPFGGGLMNLIFTDTLIMANFPAEFEDVHSDIGSGFDNQHISLFESIIPADTYSTLVAIYDTVRFLNDLNLNTEFDEFGEMQYIGDSNLNGTFDFLRENRVTISSFDILLRNKFSGSYTSLSDIPGISEQLPMDLPMVDTTFAYLYWTKDLKYPLAEIELNIAYDSVYNATFRYAYLSSVGTNNIAMHNVYPNPSSDFINVVFADYKDCEFIIYSIDGREVKHLNLSTVQTKISINDLKSGNYIYHIRDKANISIAGGKFIKK